MQHTQNPFQRGEGAGDIMKQQHAAAADTFAPFQQALTQGWSKALESFQSLGMSGTSGQAPSFEMPRFSLSTEKLQELQQQYISEATRLWRQDMTSGMGDKRFASEAWSSNPVSSFAAAVYLLNARTLLGMA